MNVDQPLSTYAHDPLGKSVVWAQTSWGTWDRTMKNACRGETRVVGLVSAKLLSHWWTQHKCLKVFEKTVWKINIANRVTKTNKNKQTSAVEPVGNGASFWRTGIVHAPVHISVWAQVFLSPWGWSWGRTYPYFWEGSCPAALGLSWGRTYTLFLATPQGRAWPDPELDSGFCQSLADRTFTIPLPSETAVDVLESSNERVLESGNKYLLGRCWLFVSLQAVINKPSIMYERNLITNRSWCCGLEDICLPTAGIFRLGEQTRLTDNWRKGVKHEITTESDNSDRNVHNKICSVCTSKLSI